MKAYITAVLLIVVTTSLAQDNFSPAVERKPMVSTNKSGVAINGFDTVAYFDQNKAVKGSKDFSCEYNEATWYFSSEENRQKFLDNPEKFAPQYGGYCSHALAENKLVDANPKAFVVRDNKLFLYSKKRFVKKAKFTFEKQKPVREKNWLSFNKSF